MHLTAVYKLRIGNRDRANLRVATQRQHDYAQRAFQILYKQRSRLIEMVTVSKPATETSAAVLKLDKKRIHDAVVQAMRTARDARPNGLHSSFHSSLIVYIEGNVTSWLQLRLDWMKGGRKGPAPGFPHLPPSTTRSGMRRWERALDDVNSVMDARQFNDWSAEVQRAARCKPIPLTFGTMTFFDQGREHYAGLLGREDGKLFLALALWPKGDRRGMATERARNRTQKGEVRNVRALPGQDLFLSASSRKSSIIVPLEFHRGHKTLFHKRALPRTATVYRKGTDWYASVAYEFEDHELIPVSGNVLAVVRGLGSLLRWVCVSPTGHILERGDLSGKDLARLIEDRLAWEKRRQEAGAVLRGNKRRSRCAAHHVYSASHQIRDIACKHSAQVVLYDDRKPRFTGDHWRPIVPKQPKGGRPPHRLKFMPWRHFHRIESVLAM
ncbi:MAG: hypothetical protein FJ315_09560, partial [SAR202 cluster bacterium]|nr:hypothetical protein [SAR202 cluster bacterium]